MVSAPDNQQAASLLSHLQGAPPEARQEREAVPTAPVAEPEPCDALLRFILSKLVESARSELAAVLEPQEPAKDGDGDETMETVILSHGPLLPTQAQTLHDVALDETYILPRSYRMPRCPQAPPPEAADDEMLETMMAVRAKRTAPVRHRSAMPSDEAD